MIEFHYETDFVLDNERKYSNWLSKAVTNESAAIDSLVFVFCSDAYLLKKNKEYLDHETYTDIITFDYSDKRTLSGDIFISVDRVRENAEKYNERFNDELLRVMSHGVLHLLGFNDKETSDTVEMRRMENNFILMFHVEH